jgi:hypothetical protein
VWRDTQGRDDIARHDAIEGLGHRQYFGLQVDSARCQLVQKQLDLTHGHGPRVVTLQGQGDLLHRLQG